MAVWCADTGDGLTRNGNFLNPAQSWTKARWVQLPDPWPPGGYQVIWQLGGAAAAETPPWIGSFTSASDSSVYSEGNTGSGGVFDDELPRTPLWVYVATRYDADTQTVSTVLDSTVIPGAFSLDLSGVIPQTGEWLGTDTASEANLSVGYDRSWQAWLTISELLRERASQTPIRSANLLSNTPLTGADDLTDTVGGHDWTALGALVTIAGPLPLLSANQPLIIVRRTLDTFPADQPLDVVNYLRGYTAEGLMVTDYTVTGVANLFRVGMDARPQVIHGRVYVTTQIDTGTVFPDVTTTNAMYSWDVLTGENQSSFPLPSAPNSLKALRATPEGALALQVRTNAGSDTNVVSVYSPVGGLLSTSVPIVDNDGLSVWEDFVYSADGQTIYAVTHSDLVQYTSGGAYVGALTHFIDVFDDYSPRLENYSSLLAMPASTSSNLVSFALLDTAGAVDFNAPALDDDAAVNVAVEGSHTAVWMQGNTPQGTAPQIINYLYRQTNPAGLLQRVPVYGWLIPDVQTDVMERSISAQCTVYANATPEPPPTPDLTTIRRPIRRVRRAPHLWDGTSGHRLRYPGLQLLVESGVKLPDDGQLTFTLRWSDDGGHTWSNAHTITGAKLGQYRYRFWWRRLGQSRDRIFELVNSDDATIVLLDALLTPEPIEGGS